MRSRAVLLAMAAGSLAAPLIVWPGGRTIRQLLDPCVHWGAPSQINLTIPQKDGCNAVSITSETKGQALARLTLIQGGMLTGILAGMVGAFRARPVLVLLGAGFLFAAAAPAMSGGGAALMIASGLLVLAARGCGPLGRTAGWGLRTIGLLGGVAAVWGLLAVFSRPQVSLFLTAPPLFVSLAAWLPARRAPSAAPQR